MACMSSRQILINIVLSNMPLLEIVGKPFWAYWVPDTGEHYAYPWVQYPFSFCMIWKISLVNAMVKVLLVIIKFDRKNSRTLFETFLVALCKMNLFRLYWETGIYCDTNLTMRLIGFAVINHPLVSSSKVIGSSACEFINSNRRVELMRSWVGACSNKTGH